MSELKRVFLGIDLSADLKKGIEQFKMKCGLNKLPIKLVETENSHVAIKFLDSLADQQILQVIELVKKNIILFSGFNILLDGWVIFPNTYNPKVLALNVISNELQKLGQHLINELENLAFINKEGGSYTPHLTLGRIKERLTEAEMRGILNLKYKQNFEVNSIQLFESKLSSSGPIYKILNNFKLQS
jgi:RNA 2',3'-cyclic 3'-phosphodiesterase